MTESDKQDNSNTDSILSASSGPLVFVSHDGRDAQLAEAFSKLLKSVSAGMIKTFRSSDKKGTDGIDFGDEWYARLMSKLQATSDVVCLFTERSLDRPWILFEAGVAKGKVKTPVVGLALGVPLSRVSSGPFYNFHNMDDSEDDLTKLVNQLAKRVPNLELDSDVVVAQVRAFKASEAKILKAMPAMAGGTSAEATDDNPLSKLAEEMKALPSRVAEKVAEVRDPGRRRRMRRFHPMMFEELLHMSDMRGDPFAILMAASMLREELPWLYEFTMEVYRTVKAGEVSAIEAELRRVRHFAEMLTRRPMMLELGLVDKESYILALEFPHILEHALQRSLNASKPRGRKSARSPQLPGTPG